MITVQLVKRILQGLESEENDKSTQYQNYCIKETDDGRRAFHEGSDKVSGVKAFHYGKVEELDSESTDFFEAMAAGTEYAIIAYWKLNTVDDTFKCYDFYFAPSPCKRIIK